MSSVNQDSATIQTKLTILVIRDIGSDFVADDLAALARQLSLRLNEPVVLYEELNSTTTLVDLLESSLTPHIQQLTLVPFGVLAIPERGAISQALVWTQRHAPHLKIQLAPPLTWIEVSNWLRLQAIDSLVTTGSRPDHTGVLLVGPSSPNPMTNANLPCLAHFVRETNSFAAVQHAFVDALPPTIEEGLRTLTLSQVETVCVIPWLLFGTRQVDEIRQIVKRTGDAFRLTTHVMGTKLCHPALLNLLVANQLAAIPVNVTRLERRNEPATQQSDSPDANISTTESLEALQELESRINAMLPPEYRGEYESVSPQSMGTAGLKFDGEGKVAWDEIWTSFCDLALAGGPPHRGTLLEAVTAEEAHADLERYEAVVTEIGRGIRMVTGLSIVKSKSAGWVGVRCRDEEMAVWLMRAIIVENVMVRREGDVIYLPAGPHFTLKREIKNVVTAVAKTVHYWTAHLNSRPKNE